VRSIEIINSSGWGSTGWATSTAWHSTWESTWHSWHAAAWGTTSSLVNSHHDWVVLGFDLLHFSVDFFGFSSWVCF
jgi:hypothetical protein